MGCQPGFHSRPDLWRYDPKIRRVDSDDVLLVSLPALLCPAANDLLKLTIDNFAFIQRPMQNLPDCTRGPASGALTGGLHTFGVQALGDPADPEAASVHAIDLADDRCLTLIHHAENMQTVTTSRDHLFVVVAVHFPASDVAGFSLAEHCVIGPLLGPFAFHLGSEIRQGEHDLVRRAFEGALAVLEIEEQPDAGVDDLLERIGGFDRFTSKP